MKILIDIGHPAHVHLFKNLSRNLQKKGHSIFFSVRTGEQEAQLLEKYDFNYKIIGKKKHSIIGKVYGLFLFTFRILILSLKIRTDLFISHGSIYAGYVAFMLRKSHIALEDSGNMEQLRFSIPTSSVIISPDILDKKLGKKHITYKGYHELSYLSPKYFKPDNNIKSLLGLSEDDSYCILRFIAWGASHDLYQNGLSQEDKIEIVMYLSDKLKVFISSEMPLPLEFTSYEFPLGPEKIHDALAGAEIVISEGATIAAESGVLGTPSIYVNSIKRCYNEDLATYGLVFNFRNPVGIISKIEEILAIPNYKSIFQQRSEKMLRDKIDVTSFLTWFIENYPESAKIVQTDPDYQFRFHEN